MRALFRELVRYGNLRFCLITLDGINWDIVVMHEEVRPLVLKKVNISCRELLLERQCKVALA